MSAEPFVKTDAAEARLAQGHERALLDPAAPVSGRWVAQDLTRVADRPQIAGDDFVERRAFRAGDLDDAVSRRCKRDLGDHGGDVVRSERRLCQEIFALFRGVNLYSTDARASDTFEALIPARVA